MRYIKTFEQLNKRVCAIFAHPDDELNILSILGDLNIDIHYLTKGEAGWRYSDYYGDPLDVRNNIISLREEETKSMSEYFNFKYLFYDFEDINNQTKTAWDINKLDKTIKEISGKYDIIYTIGLLEREHHQHKQICESLMRIAPEKVIYGNYWINSPNELGIEKYKSYIIKRNDLENFIDILKSQGTMRNAIEVTGNIIWKP